VAKAQSNDYPKIQRLQGAILFPCNVTTATDEMAGTIYNYDEYVIPDLGQQVADAELFVKENWRMLQAAAMNDRTASPKQAGMWEIYKAEIEAKFRVNPVAEGVAK
jgi:ABC-type microcin C transport system permease subunit YejE